MIYSYKVVAQRLLSIEFYYKCYLNADQYNPIAWIKLILVSTVTMTLSYTDALLSKDILY